MVIQAIAVVVKIYLTDKAISCKVITWTKRLTRKPCKRR